MENSDRMKKIALIREDLCIPGGCERVCVNLSNELSKFYDVHLINLYKNKSAYAINEKVKFIFLRNNKLRLRYSLIDDVKFLRSYLINNNIEIVLIIGGTAVLQTILATRGLDIKVVFCQHNSIIADLLVKSLKEKVYKLILNKLIKNFSDSIIVLTQKDLEEYFINKLNVKRENLKNIYNFISDKLYKTNNKYNLGSKKIITVGRINYAKGYEYLMQVAKSVFAKHPDWEWHVYGDGEENYKQQIINLIKQNNLEKHIILQGNHSNIYDLYPDYAFSVMTSRYESFGMVLVEAKAKKLPLISFDINSGPSDIVRNGVDGFLIKPFDCEAMADKICELIENPELRQRLSDNAHGNLDKFSKEKIIKQWCDLIDAI